MVSGLPPKNWTVKRVVIFIDDLVFKIHRGFIAKSAVEPLSVIKQLDIVKDGQPGLVDVGERFVVDEFIFETAQKDSMAALS